MTVYVDDMRRPARPAGYRGSGTPRWSHLMADTPAELAAFAARLSLRESWLQHAGTVLEHYDVTDTTRAIALRMGAQPMRYGREGGLYSWWKRSRDCAADDTAERRAAFVAEYVRNHGTEPPVVEPAGGEQ